MHLHCERLRAEVPASNPEWSDAALLFRFRSAEHLALHRANLHAETSAEIEKGSVDALCSWMGALTLEFGPQPRSVHTARVYLRRFFTTTSVLVVENPKVVALACLFIASKLDQVRWPVTMHGSLQKRGLRVPDLARASGDAGISADMIVDCELLVLNALQWYLRVEEDTPPAMMSPACDDDACLLAWAGEGVAAECTDD
jgi:hypothetical protein